MKLDFQKELIGIDFLKFLIYNINIEMQRRLLLWQQVQQRIR